MCLILKFKVFLLVMVLVLFFVLVFSGGVVLILKKQVDVEVKDICECLFGDCCVEFEYYVQIVMGSIQVEYDCLVNGDLNVCVEVIVCLLKIKYGKDGYIFGYDFQVVCLFCGDSLVDVGKSFCDCCDFSGVYFNCELVEVGCNGSYYVIYILLLLGNESVMVFKLFYILYLLKWDMVIGLVINFDGVEVQLVEIKQDIDECIGILIVSIVGIVGVFLVVLLVIGLVVVNVMLWLLYQICQNFDDIVVGEGDLICCLLVISYDELGELVGFFNCFVEKIYGLVWQIVGMIGDFK